jgi:HSP20 family molecular chaperone IbpA
MFNTISLFTPTTFEDLSKEFFESTRKNYFSTDYEFYKTEDGFYQIFEVPGFNKSNLKVEVEGSKLTIDGKRVYKTSNGERSKVFHKIYDLGNKVDTSKLEATIEDGILAIFIPTPSEKEVRKKISLL